MAPPGATTANMVGDIYANLEHIHNKYGANGFLKLPEEIQSKIEMSGITLFKYHTIPEILQRAVPGLAAPDVELITGSRFYHLDAKQETYWREQTRLLRLGLLGPLDCWLRGRSCDSEIEAQLHRWRTEKEARGIAGIQLDSSRQPAFPEGVLIDLDDSNGSSRIQRDVGRTLGFDETPLPWPPKQSALRGASIPTDDVVDNALDLRRRPKREAAWISDDEAEDTSPARMTEALSKAVAPHLKSPPREAAATNENDHPRPSVSSIGARPFTPILDFLLQETVDITNMEDLKPFIDRILQALTDLRLQHPNMSLKVRRSGMRIDYAPDCKDVTGIAARLTAATERSLTAKQATKDCKDPADHFEYLLRGLFSRNQNTNIFAGVYGDKKWRWDGTGISGFYDSLLYKIRATTSNKWRACRPYKPDTKERTVTALMEIVRAHVSKQNPNHELFIPISEGLKKLTVSQGAALSTRVTRWGLQTDDEGFAVHLLSCFDRPGLTSEEYEDMMEQKLWSLNRFAPSIIWRTRPNNPPRRNA